MEIVRHGTLKEPVETWYEFEDGGKFQTLHTEDLRPQNYNIWTKTIYDFKQNLWIYVNSISAYLLPLWIDSF